MRARLLLIQLVVCLRMMALFGTLIDIVIIVKMNYDEENIFFLLYSLGRLCCLFKLKLLINILMCIFFAPPCVVCLKVLAWKQLMEKGSSLCSFLFLFLEFASKRNQYSFVAGSVSCGVVWHLVCRIASEVAATATPYWPAPVMVKTFFQASSEQW